MGRKIYFGIVNALIHFQRCLGSHKANMEDFIYNFLFNRDISIEKKEKYDKTIRKQTIIFIPVTYISLQSSFITS
jgi:hypothetical protein